MWQVICDVEGGKTGKLVTDSWLKAVAQLVVWRLKRRTTTMERYDAAQEMQRPRPAE